MDRTARCCRWHKRRRGCTTRQWQMSCWSSRLNSHLCWAQRLQAVMMSPLQPPLIHSNGPNDPLLCSCSHFAFLHLHPSPPLSQAVHTVPQCQVSSSTAEMAKHTPFPHAWTLPEGEANRSASWVAASPLSAPHLSADPCPASGATTRTRLSFPSASSPRRLRVGKGEGNQTTMLRRQRSPCQGRSPEQCDDEVLGHSEGGPGGCTELGSQTLQAKKIKKPLHEEIQATASYSCAFILFSATTGRWSVIFSLV